MKFSLADGSVAEVLELDGVHVVFAAERPVPPGTPLVLFDATGERFSAKVRRCKKLEESSRFRIEARWLDLSREQRARLSAPSSEHD